MRKDRKPEAARIGYHPLARIARGAVWAACVAAAWTFPLYPGIRINLDAAAGQGEAWTYFAIGSIIFGAVSVEVTRICLRCSNFATAGIAAFVASLFLMLNVATSIGNSAAHSEHSREDRSSQIEKKQRLARMREQSSQARKAQHDIAGDATPEGIEGELQAAKAADAKRWNATDGCDLSKITAGPTRSFCEAIHKLEAKLAAARKQDELDTKIAEIDSESAGATPASLDPRADNIAQFIGVFGYAVDANGKLLIASSYDWGKAVGLDIMAFFGPAFLMILIGHMLGERKERPETQEKPQEAMKQKAAVLVDDLPKAAPEPLLALESDIGEDPEIHSFFVRCLEKCDGQHMTSAALGALWKSDCDETGVEPCSPKAFSLRIRRYCQHDPNNGRPRYLNVRKKTAQPAIRMVVSN